MKFFFKESGAMRSSKDISEFVERGLKAHRSYEAHLRSILERFPEETREFILAPWYRDPRSHRCPHDGWLRQLQVRRDEVLGDCLSARITLLGAYHDMILEFEYDGVSELRAGIAPVKGAQPNDWLFDEFDLVGEDRVSHEIMWMNGEDWKIVANRVRFRAKEIGGIGDAEKGTTEGRGQ